MRKKTHDKATRMLNKGVLLLEAAAAIFIISLIAVALAVPGFLEWKTAMFLFVLWQPVLVAGVFCMGLYVKHRDIPYHIDPETGEPFDDLT